MHARRWVYPTIGHWAVQAALGIPNIRTLKVMAQERLRTAWLRRCRNSPPFAEPRVSLRRSQEKAEVTPAILLRTIMFLSNKTRKISIIQTGGY